MSQRRARHLLFVLMTLALLANGFQWYFSSSRGLYSSDDMREYFKTEGSKSGFGNFVFSDFCGAQYQSVVCSREFLTNDRGVIYSGINPSMWGEISVLLLVGVLAFLVFISGPDSRINSKHFVVGGLVGMLLLVVDQARYIITSVLATTKHFFTWSSYCFHGDWGWFFDILGYVFMYAVVAVAVAGFSAAVAALRPSHIDVANPKMGQASKLNMICRVYTWLPYFSYMGFAVWTICTGIDSNASQAYAAQAIFITLVLLFVFIVCVHTMYQVSRVYDRLARARTQESNEGEILENPMHCYLGPFGSKAFNTLIRILLPPLAMLALWYDVFSAFLAV